MERAASSQYGAAGSNALVAALAQTLGEVLRASLGAFSAVLVRPFFYNLAGSLFWFYGTVHPSFLTAPHAMRGNFPIMIGSSSFFDLY